MQRLRCRHGWARAADRQFGRGFLFGGVASGGSGGAGGDFYCCGTWPFSTAGAPDGYGLYLDAGSEAVVMDTAPSSTGGSGMMSSLPGIVGRYSVAGPVESGEPATLVFAGPPGWNVLLAYSYRYAPESVPSFSGWSVVDPEAPTLFIGAIPATGTLQVALPFHLHPAESAAVLYTQAKLYDTVTGTPYLAEPSALLVYRDPAHPSARSSARWA